MARQCISVVMYSEINIPKHCNPLERWFLGRKIFLNLEPFFSGHSMAISAEVIPKCGLVGEPPKNALTSRLGIIVICPDFLFGVR